MRLRVIPPERTGSPAPLRVGELGGLFLVLFVYSEHLQNREREEVLMHEVVACFGLALVVGDAGAALAALVSAAAERMRGGRWT